MLCVQVQALLYWVRHTLFFLLLVVLSTQFLGEMLPGDVSLPYCQHGRSIMSPKVSAGFAMNIYIPRKGLPVPSEDRHTFIWLWSWLHCWFGATISQLWVRRYEIRSWSGVIMWAL